MGLIELSSVTEGWPEAYTTRCSVAVAGRLSRGRLVVLAALLLVVSPRLALLFGPSLLLEWRQRRRSQVRRSPNRR